MASPVFDLDVLRSFATGMALGSYARAADRLGRSTSAVSAQLKKLEAQAGTALFRKAGRGLALTDAGQTMLAYAHRLLELNDEAAAAMRGARLHGLVRLGLQEDFGETLLPGVLGRFTRAHPQVRVEACMARCTELRERLSLGKLDLALVWETGNQAPLPHGECVLEAPLQWIGAASDHAAERPPWWPKGRAGGGRHAQPLPLVLLDAPCPVREMTTAALDRAGIPWRHGFSSSSLAALWAASAAGLGLTVRTSFGLPRSVEVLDASAAGLPELPAISLWLYRAQAQPEATVARLADLLRQALPQSEAPTRQTAASRPQGVPA
ncbi:LysR substrate-binding domain-containing protein [Variovorax ginsengisoli]|uniref:DNA-binding transcriptional LysR family regulator n=1 Tax=Variovorax ginsengisoli TaxID=363844 RepID=A0ABT9S2P6_9BURK|nr:LysR substrate-binding domain-containing protein [Variovorax ginsengisoli]MDP9898051.1 DNA-binding transcriptional LysR family regulator [Variovorax ginsengisoli]